MRIDEAIVTVKARHRGFPVLVKALAYYEDNQRQRPLYKRNKGAWHTAWGFVTLLHDMLEDLDRVHDYRHELGTRQTERRAEG